MKKKVHLNPIQRYNRLFKYLNLDQSLFSSFLITIVILLYAFAILRLFSVLGIPVGRGEVAFK